MVNKFDDAVSLYSKEKEARLGRNGINEYELEVLRVHYDRLEGKSEQIERAVIRTVNELTAKGLYK